MLKLKKHHYLHLSRIFTLLAGTIFFLNQKGITNAGFADPATTCASVTEIPESECVALLEFYNAMDGDNRFARNGWIDGVDYDDVSGICSWAGITCNPTNVTNINLAGNGLAGIIPDSIGNLTNLLSIDLSYNSITDIQPNAFVGISALLYLVLSNNQITSIQSNDFAGLSIALYSTLDLSNNGITSIESGTFADLSPLYSLWLSSNNITSIESGTFAGLSNLNGLSLYSNNITSIESGTFADLSNLSDLDLSNNGITSIESISFVGLSSLASLELNDNQITNIESGNFADLSNLSDLYLNNNRITSIESGDFAGLSSLGSLQLSYNYIANIQSTAFADLSVLWDLDLSSNYMTSIESGDFAGLSSLTNLYLESNQITNIENGSFTDLSLLSYLRLNNNQITSIESGDFAGDHSLLTNLYLDYNQISSIQAGSFDGLNLLPNPSLIRYNCLDTGNLSSDITTTLNGADASRKTYQYVCVGISYNPPTSTAGPVTGTLVFTGGTSADRATLNSVYPTISNTSHVWNTNGTYGFSLSSYTSNLLRHKNGSTFSTLTGNVTWIGGSTPPPSSPICGNSLVETGELCDNGPSNSLTGDCSLTCTINYKSYIVGHENEDNGRWFNVGVNNYSYGNLWKDIVNVGDTVSFVFNYINTLGRASTSDDYLPTPFGFKYHSTTPVASGGVSNVTFKVKVFNK